MRPARQPAGSRVSIRRRGRSAPGYWRNRTSSSQPGAERGASEFEEISWEEAFATITERLQPIDAACGQLRRRD